MKELWLVLMRDGGREATSYPARVEGEDLFCLFLLLLTFVDCEAGLLFYILI